MGSGSPADVEKDVPGSKVSESMELSCADLALDKRVNRKFDLRILPWIFGICSICLPSECDAS
ncbi:hypothetical protein MMYC01_200431 [Madurella mycetomatis]|uniref:Uncharacterized protein n=1 Tax=Madurella mycetomatis TaxID=100816 RepID=A0A175WHD4_9PEZI|nr:hypothetical protein MMYC01_200431 [Madurella mycetomatis]